MKTEEEEESQYDFESRESSAEIVVLKKEFSFPLSPSSNSSTPSTPLTTWPYSTLLTPQSLAGISPSQLVLGVKVKRSSSPASSSAEPGAKRVKRKARTEEEKQASAYERTMRNRRAAQESRDRKKRQVEALEEENQRLLEENASMRRRIEQLEAQQSPTIADTEPLTYSVATSPMYPISSPPTYSEATSPSYPDPTSLTYTDAPYPDDPIIKAEEFSPESFDSTFHPAVSLDLSGEYIYNLDDFVYNSPDEPSMDENLSATALLDTFLNDDEDLFDEREPCAVSCDV